MDAVKDLAQLAIRGGAAEDGLTLLAIAERERTSLGSPMFTPDEVADRDEAERTARRALTADQVAKAYRAASGTSLAAAVADLTRSAREPYETSGPDS